MSLSRRNVVPSNSDMDYRIFNVHKWSLCVRIHTRVGHTDGESVQQFLTWKNYHIFFLVLVTGFEPRVFGSRVWHSTNWATPSPHLTLSLNWGSLERRVNHSTRGHSVKRWLSWKWCHAASLLHGLLFSILCRDKLRMTCRTTSRRREVSEKSSRSNHKSSRDSHSLPSPRLENWPPHATDTPFYETSFSACAMLSHSPDFSQRLCLTYCVDGFFRRTRLSSVTSRLLSVFVAVLIFTPSVILSVCLSFYHFSLLYWNCWPKISLWLEMCFWGGVGVGGGGAGKCVNRPV